ncbi:hypothetical protein [Sporosarcina sp. P33]|uniref:hypothetical protein n=1 Tax=Sporosarcina sp. P33 TaxID=1930764 RepID=UPI0009C19463|nr:hypothetical protein [Sporosarcina sp. P33]ARD47567.1 hypothetical protein SporoP33_04490 [Sporosarcina sp. P33]
MNELHTVTIYPNEINFNPVSELEEIVQNIHTIVSTVKYSVPLYREFGVNATFLDEPTPLIKSKLIAEVTEKVEYFEPRVLVEEILMEGNEDGRIIPTLVFSLRRGSVID